MQQQSEQGAIAQSAVEMAIAQKSREEHRALTSLLYSISRSADALEESKCLELQEQGADLRRKSVDFQMKFFGMVVQS